MTMMFLPFKRYAEFSGRSTRAEYWLFTLFVVLASFVLLMIGLGLAFAAAGAGGQSGIGLGAPEMAIVLVILFMAGGFIPGLAVTVRRFHDQDKSGWFVLLGLIPYLGSLVIMIFMLLEGTRGPNRYGPDPKQVNPSTPTASSPSQIFEPPTVLSAPQAGSYCTSCGRRLSSSVRFCPACGTPAAAGA